MNKVLILIIIIFIIRIVDILFTAENPARALGGMTSTELIPTLIGHYIAKRIWIKYESSISSGERIK